MKTIGQIEAAVCEGVCRFEQDDIGGTLLAGGLWQKTLGRMDLKTASGCTTQVSTAMKDLALAVQLARATSWIAKRLLRVALGNFQ